MYSMKEEREERKELGQWGGAKDDAERRGKDRREGDRKKESKSGRKFIFRSRKIIVT